MYPTSLIEILKRPLIPIRAIMGNYVPYVHSYLSDPYTIKLQYLYVSYVCLIKGTHFSQEVNSVGYYNTITTSTAQQQQQQTFFFLLIN